MGQWQRHLAGAEVVAVLSHEHEHFLGAMLAQLGEAEFISSTRPVGEALKVVVGGLVVESISRDGVVQLVSPFAFRAELGARVLEPLDPELSIDLLSMLARVATPLCFQPDSASEPKP